MTAGFSNQLLDYLNPSQREAVIHDKGHLLIVAGPGTGKTHTLIHRMSRWVERLTGDQKILAITFTNKAAKEIGNRLKEFAANSDKKIVVGTFHRFCLSLLSLYPAQSGVGEDFQIVDEMAIEEIAKALWPRSSHGERREMLNKISWEKSVEFERPPSEELKRYDEHLRDLNYLDYDDVLLKVVKLLEDERLRGEIQARFPFIFVDEYQDINPVQHKILLLLVGEKSLITAIGDPHQAIYGFRGSNVRFFQSFPDEFNGAKTLYLKDNYRSGKNILTASHQVISGLSIEVPALTANLYMHGDLIVHVSASDKAEAEYVVHQIEKLVGGTSMFSQDSRRVETQEQAQCAFDDIAILYRLNSMAAPLKEALERSGIPYNVCADENGEDDICPRRGSDVNIEAQKVSLLSIHAAKGLEFGVVFIIGCEENILPLKLKALSADMDEERRLFYVGMTRAKKRLYFTRAKRRFRFGKTMRNQPSRFLMDIEEQLKQVEVLERKSLKNKEKQMKLF